MNYLTTFFLISIMRSLFLVLSSSQAYLYWAVLQK